MPDPLPDPRPGPRLIDTTLREGAQAPGPYLDPDRQLALVTGLAAAGIAELELGCAVAEPGYGPDPAAALLAGARRRAPALRLSLWCRARPEDVEAACALGPDLVSFAVPASDLHLERRLGRDRTWAVERVRTLAALARSLGAAEVGVGLEDASRADPAFVAVLAATAERAGVDRLRLADTVGVAGPLGMASLVGRCRSRFDGELAVHVHDDFGMASAATVAALDAGADSADVSLLGLGERAGIARTEQVAAWLAVRHGHGYDLAVLAALCRRLGEWVGRPVPAHAAVIGPEVFGCETGLHLDGLAKDPATYQPFPPERVGAVARHRLGRHCGRAAVAARLRERGLHPEAAELTALTAAIRDAATARGRALTRAEVDVLLTTRTEQCPGA